MHNSRKSTENLFADTLPKPTQTTNLRYSDNNTYGLNSQINMTKSNVFLRTEMPQHLTFKNTNNITKTSTIFVQGDPSQRLTFKNSTGGTKKQNTPTSTHSTQSEITLNFKGKVSDNKQPDIPKPASLSAYRKLSGDGSYEFKEIYKQSSLEPSISHSSGGSVKLQFKQTNSANNNNTYVSIVDGSPHSQDQIKFRYKPNIQEALKESVGSYSSSLQQISENKAPQQGQLSGGRLQRFRKNPYQNYSNNFQEKYFQKERANVFHTSQDANNGQNSQKMQNLSGFQDNFKPTIFVSGAPGNLYERTDKFNEPPNITSSSANNSFYYYSYPHPGFVNPYHKQSKAQIAGSSAGNNSHTDNKSLNNMYGPSPLQSPNIQKPQTIQNKLQQKLNRITPNSQNSNFSKFKNTSGENSSSGKYSSGRKQRTSLKAQKKLSDFKLGKKLGKGKFGDVYLAQDTNTGFICALKIIKKKTLIEEKVDHQFARELKIQFYLNHANLIGLYGFFDDQTNFYMLLEYAVDGHLFGILKQKKRFTEEQAKKLVRQICEGVEYMHLERILHRDLKPENILIQFGIPKICDFGWAIYRADTLRDTFCGTPLYISPQILTGQKYDQSADLWAVGILTYELLVGKIPFKIKCEQDLIKIEIVFPENIVLSDMSKDFVMRMLQRDTNVRFDIDQALNHPFLRYKEVSKPLA